VVVVTFAVRGDTVYTAVDRMPKSGINLMRLRNVGENPRVTTLADEDPADWERTICRRCRRNRSEQ
jgi:hypothetical protein